MQVFPSALRDLWTTWELPVMLLLSLFLQFLLIPMGFKRKYSSNNWLQWLLWFAYLSADSVATISLGILSSGNDSLESRYVIRALWAPFFLLHLGGPDTITAYSMQDNDLWLRHLLGLLIHAGFTIYIFMLSLQPTTLNFVAIPVFVAGIIKYGERTWALRSASTENLRDQEVPSRSMNLSNNHNFKFPIQIYISEPSPRFTDLHLLHVAHCFFDRNKYVFADLILSSNDLKQALYYFLNFDYKSAFKVVELELGFLHDLLYTKASAIHSRCGALLRLTSLSSIVAALMAFCTCNKHRYPPADVYLTFILLSGALGLEIYSIVLLLCSDWSVIWLTQIDNFFARVILKAVCGFGWSVGKTRWSNSVPQFNLITHCFEDIHGRHTKKLLKISSYITQLTSTASRPISDELKNRIFEQLKEMIEKEHENNGGDEIDWILAKRRFNQESSIVKSDYAQNILSLHIATEICYYSDYKKADLNNSSLVEDTRLVSNFLAYILAHRPSLFSNGMGRTKFDATINDTKEFLKQNKQHSKLLGSIDEAYECILMKLNVIDDCDDIVNELGSGSMFPRGCWAAKRLQELEECERWEEISHEWVEMLVNISRHCKPYDQIELLGRGGDLLTHVWFLAHHLGYTRQAYDIRGDEEREIYEFPAIAKTSHSF